MKTINIISTKIWHYTFSDFLFMEQEDKKIQKQSSKQCNQVFSLWNKDENSKSKKYFLLFYMYFKFKLEYINEALLSISYIQAKTNNRKTLSSFLISQFSKNFKF